jgi:glycosyltransferase involved in cell wall biosynthesis
MPTLSVNMIAYNTARYVAEAVESILCQTYPDFEFIIIDDGSTDGTGAILERYAARDARIRLVRRENRGIVASRNEALALSTGEFVAVMDSDDVALPDRLERQVTFLREHPDVVCVGGWLELIDGAGRRLIQFQTPTDDAWLQQRALRGRTPMTGPTMTMRRQDVEVVGRYRPGYDPTEDLDLLLRLGERGHLVVLPQVVLRYRLHDQSISVRQQRRQLEMARAASDSACDRRGISRRYEPAPPGRPDGTRGSRHEFALRYGWWAFKGGERGAALHYGIKAAAICPWRPGGWRLLACALIKPARRSG